MRARNKLLLLSLLFLPCACAHKAPLPPAGLPGFEAMGTAAENGAAQEASAVPASTAPVNGDTPVTEQDIRDLEEGEAGTQIFISSAPPAPPLPVNLGGNGKLTITRHDTGEKISVQYRNKNGEYDRAALMKINHIMRCSLNGKETEIAVKLVELLDAVEDKFGKKGLRLLSGYRTLELNRTIKGSAEHSLHMLGWAADIRISGYSSTKVKTYAQKLRVGGVGYYPSKGFTHLDVGKPRYWVVKKAPRKRRVVRRKSSKAAKTGSSKSVKPSPKKTIKRKSR